MRRRVTPAPGRSRHQPRPGWRVAVWGTVILLGNLAGAQELVSIPDEGTRATRDYVAPADFRVTDVATTVAIAEAAGENLPLVIRPDTRIAAQVVAEFDAAFRKTRDAYLDALEATFGSRTIGSREINSSRFRSFRTEFQAANPLFPVNLVLAQTWAKGYDGEPTRERLAHNLQATMSRSLIGDVRQASTVFVATLSASDRIRSWSEASSHCRAINRSEILTVEDAGQELRQSLDVLDRGAGGFMTGLLRANFVEDAFLTALLLDERMAEKVTRRNYRAGETIIRRGDMIDRAGALALTQMTRLGLTPGDTPASPATMPPHSPEVTPESVVLPVTPEPESTPETLPQSWLPAVVVVAALAMIVGGVLLIRRGRRRAPTAVTGEWLDESSVKPAGNIREAIIPHLARELKNRLVQALFAQRQALLHNEASATERVAILEERLAKLQPAIAEKIRGYERRIQALEAEIEEKDQETRDLIRAKLVLARKELDAEITRHHIDWN